MKHTLSSLPYALLVAMVLCVVSAGAWAIAPQHQVAQTYGGTRLYAHDSVIISPNALVTPLGADNRYSQTTTDLSTVTANLKKKDSLCRSIVNASENDYFVPWRSANATGYDQVNEWTSFINTVESGAITGLTIGSCCYPRMNPNKPCGVLYPMGKRIAGAFPSIDPETQAKSAEVPGYGAEGDVSTETVGYNRKQTWVCDGGEWVYTRDEGGCFQDGKCNTYDAASNPSGYNGASVNAIPSSSRDTLMCNGVTPTTINSNSFPQPDTIAGAGVYGTGGWSWKCPGQNGGTSETCHANYAGGPMNGVCGYANGRAYQTAPTTSSLCYVGTPSNLSASTQTKWIWTCAGVNGGKTASCSANYPTTPNAGCGTYASGGRSSGLLSFETVNGLPNPSYLCSSTSKLYGDVAGNGTSGAPWRWTCLAENNTTIVCSNTYTKSGICGLANGNYLPSAPNVSANMCKQGRWYNKATTSPSANSVVTDSANKAWTWACLGHNLTTGAISNDLCSATTCNECKGTDTEYVTTKLSGTYGNCQFDSSQASLSYVRVYTRQTSTDDVNVTVGLNESGVGHFTSNTDVANGYCSPCYKRTTRATQGMVTLQSCTENPPETS